MNLLHSFLLVLSLTCPQKTEVKLHSECTCSNIYLTPIPRLFGERESQWFRLNYWGCTGSEIPTFMVYPEGTFFEQFADDTNGDGFPENEPGNIVAFLGPSGKYLITATLPCGIQTSLEWNYQR